ncbi:MAG TPA: PAS domain-containing sensor histidine kinase, partial [Humisphaera sp.]
AGGDIVGRSVVAVWPGGSGRTDGGGALPEAGGRREEQGWARRRDGSRFWASVALAPVTDEAGQSRGYAMSVRDLTERRTLERDVLEVAEREQLRIGHDLHDGLGQELTGIAMLSTALSERLTAEGQAALAVEAEEVADLVHGAIAHTRDLARGLCPVDLEYSGLTPALQQLADRVGRLPGVACTFEADGRARPSSTAAPHLYRIAQEAITNAIRHGRAQRLEVTLRESAGTLTLAVADDGVGLPSDRVADGMGLRLMRYRAATIRGVLEVRRRPAGGTIVECAVADGGSETDG